MQAYGSTKRQLADRKNYSILITEKLCKIYNRMEMLIYGIHEF